MEVRQQQPAEHPTQMIRPVNKHVHKLPPEEYPFAPQPASTKPGAVQAQYVEHEMYRGEFVIRGKQCGGLVNGGPLAPADAQAASDSAWAPIKEAAAKFQSSNTAFLDWKRLSGSLADMQQDLAAAIEQANKSDQEFEAAVTGGKDSGPAEAAGAAARQREASLRHQIDLISPKVAPAHRAMVDAWLLIARGIMDSISAKSRVELQEQVEALEAKLPGYIKAARQAWVKYLAFGDFENTATRMLPAMPRVDAVAAQAAASAQKVKEIGEATVGGPRGAVAIKGISHRSPLHPNNLARG